MSEWWHKDVLDMKDYSIVIEQKDRLHLQVGIKASSRGLDCYIDELPLVLKAIAEAKEKLKATPKPQGEQEEGK